MRRMASGVVVLALAVVVAVPGTAFAQTSGIAALASFFARLLLSCNNRRAKNGAVDRFAGLYPAIASAPTGAVGAVGSALA